MSERPPSDLSCLQDEGLEAPKALTDQVMRRVALLGRPRARRHWLIDGPRLSIALRPFLLSSAVVLVVATVVMAFGGNNDHHELVGGIVKSSPASGTSNTAPTLVRFALPAPSADRVFLSGDFNGWSIDRTPLRRGHDGIWTALVPLPPGTFQYAYVVDGRFVPDPHAETYRPDGFGGTNAVLRIASATDPG